MVPTSTSGAVGDDVQTMAERAKELAAGTDDEQLVERGDGGAVGLRVEVGRGHQVPEDVGATSLHDGEPGSREQGLDLVGVEAPGQRVGCSPPAGGVDEGGAGLLELAGDGLGEHDGETTRDQQRQQPARNERGLDRPQGGLGIVDELEGAVAAGQVELTTGQRLGEAVSIALDGGDP